MVDILLPDDVVSLPENIQKVGVFVNQDIEQIIEMANAYQLDIIQLHGNESPVFCRSLRAKGFKVMKAFGIDEYFDFQVMEPYQEVVDYFLFDTKTPKHGGSGLSFDWNKLKEYPYDIPFFVGGGVGLENLDVLLSMNLPHLHAVDMNSRLEVSPGVKDIEKVKTAVRMVSSHSLNSGNEN